VIRHDFGAGPRVLAGFGQGVEYEAIDGASRSRGCDQSRARCRCTQARYVVPLLVANAVIMSYIATSVGEPGVTHRPVERCNSRMLIVAMCTM